SEANRVARKRLQFNGDMFENVRQVGSAAQPLEESTALATTAAMLDHPGQPGHEPVVETGQTVRGRVFPLAEIDPGLKDRVSSPEIRPTQGKNFLNFHGRATAGGQLSGGGQGRSNGGTVGTGLPIYDKITWQTH